MKVKAIYISGKIMLARLRGILIINTLVNNLLQYGVGIKTPSFLLQRAPTRVVKQLDAPGLRAM